MSKILTWLWLSLFVVLMVLPVPVSAQSQVIWTEEWNDGWRDRWDYFGGRNDYCDHAQSGVLVQDCWSTALVSRQAFPVSQRIEFTGTIFSRPGINSHSPKNLAHHVLFSVDDGPGEEYCGLYLWYEPSTRKDRVLIISAPHHRFLPQRFEHRTHEVTIIWVPIGLRNAEGEQVGNCFYYLDGEQISHTAYKFVQPEVTLWQGATSVNSGEGDNGTTSYAEHGQIIVKVGR